MIQYTQIYYHLDGHSRYEAQQSKAKRKLHIVTLNSFVIEFSPKKFIGGRCVRVVTSLRHGDARHGGNNDRRERQRKRRQDEGMVESDEDNFQRRLGSAHGGRLCGESKQESQGTACNEGSRRHADSTEIAGSRRGKVRYYLFVEPICIHTVVS
jgi:hypothetical protein